MPLLQKILERSRGLRYPQEYLCLDAGSFGETLHWYRADGNRVGPELTQEHLFVGYAPLLLALPQRLAPHDRLQVVVSPEPLASGQALPLQPLGRMELRLLARADRLAFFEATRATHRFLPPYRQALIDRHNRWYRQGAGNVFLEGNRYRQVQLAYALPRTIALITVGGGGRFNLFPTDLHGPSGDRYIVSLRHAGKACAQVEAAGRIHLAEMEPAAFRSVYALGKNHMQPLKEATGFPFGPLRSPGWNLPLPTGAVTGYELELTGSLDAGIHRLLRFRIRSRSGYAPGAGTLAHVHNVYATWRYKNRGGGNYLLR